MEMSIDEWKLVFDENSAASELEYLLKIIQKQEAKDDIEKAINRKHQSVIKVAIQACKFRADYETRLKADMVAMLTDMLIDVEEIASREQWCDYANDNCISRYDIENLIQQKIDSLKAEIEPQADKEQTDGQ